ncbi:DNA polymerase III subunit gamma/tau [Candidatus Margulisiibacteriota bacterium]
MSHVTFYRKYRSNNFDEIVGQDHIIGTLKNAIEHDRLSQAYVFSGPRGTGKTSTARILAKALNCRQGKSVNPCHECDLCKKIARAQSVDVIEIDAASNTGVDNIRVLNEQVNFTTVECLYRIYIIDEAHMLSTGAFNALLKTLEEPPANTLFILATTEPQKIPATIHSRCQHLHFRKLQNSELTGQLKLIAQNESIEISEKSLQTIARSADGCMRDAISLLDQIFSFKGENISQEDVLLILGAANYDRLYGLLGYFLSGEIKATVSELDKLFSEGVNIIQLITSISLIFQQMIFIKMGLEERLDLDDTRIEQVRKLQGQVDLKDLVFLFESFSKMEADIRWFPNPELYLQVRFLVLLDSVHNNGNDKAGSSPKEEKTSFKAAMPDISIEKISAQKIAPEPKASVETKKEDNDGQKVEVSNAQDTRETVIVDNEPQAEPAKEEGVSEGPDNFSRNWAGFLSKLAEKAGAVISMILREAKVVKMSDRVIYLTLKQDCKFYKDKLNEEKYKKLIQDILHDVFKEPLTLDFAEESADELLWDAEKNKTSFKIHSKNENDSAAEHAVKINKVVEIFEGTVIQ